MRKNLSKTALSFSVLLIITVFFPINSYALENTDYDSEEIIESLYEETGADELIFSIPDEARELMKEMSINDFSVGSLDDFSFEGVVSAVGRVIVNNITEPLSVLISVIGIILISAMFDTLKSSSISDTLSSSLNAVSTLCVIAALSPSVLSLIDSLSQAIRNSSNFMLLYVPVISVLLITSGQAVSGGTFYGVMIYISSAILRISSNLIVPLLKCILSLSIVASVSDKVSLNGFISLFRKTSKWVLCFCMSLFVAFITMKSIVTVSEDSISNKVVKFAINSFVPLVGGALSDAYQTVVSCVSLLKSGVGVAAMAAVFAIFLPAIAKCVIWQLVIAVSVSVCEVFENKKMCTLLNSLASVLSVVCAILLSIMVIYIISTAIIIIVGG